MFFLCVKIKVRRRRTNSFLFFSYEHKKPHMRFLVSAFATLLCVSAMTQDYELPVQAPREQRVVHTLFTLSYSEPYELPSWIAYKLTPEQAKMTGTSKEKFAVDPLVTTGTASPKDYKSTDSYIMAQLVPAADLYTNPKAVEESFLMSNIVPQRPTFNSFIWNVNETLIREWAKEGNILYIVTGPVLTDVPFHTFGDNKVSIPSRYYKAVLDVNANRAIGFLFPANSARGAQTAFAVSIDELEKATGLDFFPSLPDDIENAVESSKDLKKWNFEVLKQ